MVKSNDQARLAQPLIDALGIQQLARALSSRKQGIQDDEPNDYFRRILDEDLEPSDIRDQTVLVDIADWLRGGPSAMVDELFKAEERHEEYLDIWEYFALQIPNERLTVVIEALVERLIATKSRRVRLPALASCWRQNNLRHDKTILSPERLIALIQHGMPVSLPLVNDLYYFWTSTRYGPYDDEDRKNVRARSVAIAQATYSDPHALIEAISLFDGDEYGWSVRQLMEPADQEEPASDFRALADWRWLSVPLLAASELAPRYVLPQLARVVGSVRNVLRRDPIGPSQVYELEMNRVQELFQDQCDRVLTVLAAAGNADDWVVQEAARQSRALLDA